VKPVRYDSVEGKIRIGNRWLELCPSLKKGKFLGDLKNWYIHCEIGGFPRFWDDNMSQPLDRDELIEVERRLCSQCKFWDDECGCFCFPGIDFPPEDCTDETDTEGAFFCQVCGRFVDDDDVVLHHISYEPEETIEICRFCHSRIHASKEHPLKPTQKKFLEVKELMVRRGGPKPSRLCITCAHLKPRVPTEHDPWEFQCDVVFTTITHARFYGCRYFEPREKSGGRRGGEEAKG
jgi:hypothetical protein